MKVEEFLNSKMADFNRWPGFLFLNVARLGDSVLTEMLSELDITANQWPVFHQIYEHEGSTQKSLAGYCMKDPSAVLRTLDILEKKELIVRKIDEDDRRVFKIYLTEKGKKAHQKAFNIALQCTIMACDGLTIEDLDKFFDIAVTLYKNWSNMKDNAYKIKESFDSSIANQK